MGRHKQPAELNKLKGNPSKTPVKPTVSGKGSPKAPASIRTKDEIALWNRLVASMPPKVYTQADERLLAAYVHACTTLDAIMAERFTQPLSTPGSTGQPVANPLLGKQSEFSRLIATLGARLGLDPAARASLSMAEDADDEDEGFDLH